MPMESASLRTFWQTTDVLVEGDDVTYQLPTVDLIDIFDETKFWHMAVVDKTITPVAEDVSLRSARNPFSKVANNTVDFVHIRAILIQNLSPSWELSFGKGATNGWSGFFHDSVSAGSLVFTIRPNQYALFVSADKTWIVEDYSRTLRFASLYHNAPARIWVIGDMASTSRAYFTTAGTLVMQDENGDEWSLKFEDDAMLLDRVPPRYPGQPFEEGANSKAYFDPDGFMVLESFPGIKRKLSFLSDSSMELHDATSVPVNLGYTPKAELDRVNGALLMDDETGIRWRLVFRSDASMEYTTV